MRTNINIFFCYFLIIGVLLVGSCSKQENTESEIQVPTNSASLSAWIKSALDHIEFDQQVPSGMGIVLTLPDLERKKKTIRICGLLMIDSSHAITASDCVPLLTRIPNCDDFLVAMVKAGSDGEVVRPKCQKTSHYPNSSTSKSWDKEASYTIIEFSDPLVNLEQHFSLNFSGILPNQDVSTHGLSLEDSAEEKVRVKYVTNQCVIKSSMFYQAHLNENEKKVALFANHQRPEDCLVEKVIPGSLVTASGNNTGVIGLTSGMFDQSARSDKKYHSWHLYPGKIASALMVENLKCAALNSQKIDLANCRYSSIFAVLKGGWGEFLQGQGDQSTLGKLAEQESFNRLATQPEIFSYQRRVSFTSNQLGEPRIHLSFEPNCLHKDALEKLTLDRKSNYQVEILEYVYRQSCVLDYYGNMGCQLIYDSTQEKPFPIESSTLENIKRIIDMGEVIGRKVYYVPDTLYVWGAVFFCRPKQD